MLSTECSQGFDLFNNSANRFGDNHVAGESTWIVQQRNQSIEHIVAADKNHIQLISRHTEVDIGKKIFDLGWQVPVFIFDDYRIQPGPGASIGIIAGLAVASELRPDIACQATRTGILFDPGRTVAMVQSTTGIGAIRNQQGFEQLGIGRCIGKASFEVLVASIGNTVPENDEAVNRLIGYCHAWHDQGKQ